MPPPWKTAAHSGLGWQASNFFVSPFGCLPICLLWLLQQKHCLPGLKFPWTGCSGSGKRPMRENSREQIPPPGRIFPAIFHFFANTRYCPGRKAEAVFSRGKCPLWHCLGKRGRIHTKLPKQTRKKCRYSPKKRGNLS